MRVIIDQNVNESIQQFYQVAMTLHPSLSEEAVWNKKERLYNALLGLGLYPEMYPIAKKQKWAEHQYREAICEDFHFAYAICTDFDTKEQFVYIFDAVHSLLYYE